MNKLRVGIVGAGTIFPMHAYPVSTDEHAQLVAICDIKEDRAKEKATEFGCDYYTDYKDMIAKAELDVIHICLPHYLHSEVAVYALYHGVNVLTEKPMAIKYEDALKMVDAQKKTGKVLGVILQNRFNPGSKMIKAELESGAPGKILGARLNVSWFRGEDYYKNNDWRGTLEYEGGGALINQAVHTFDLMRWFVGEEIDYVDANISNRNLDFIEVEDTVEGVMCFKSGIKGLFYATNAYSMSAPVEIELHCENAVVQMSKESAEITYKDGTVKVCEPDKNESFGYGPGAKGYWGTSHVKQIRSFYESLALAKPLEVPLEEAIKTQQMVCAIYESGRTHKRVFI